MFTNNFKYLRSWIYFSLMDDFEIKSQLASTNSDIGVIWNFMQEEYVELHRKYLILLVITSNLLICVRKSWSLCGTLLGSLKVLFNRSIQSINGITMENVGYWRIKNESFCDKLYHITTMRNQMAIRQNDFIGKIFCQKVIHLTTRLFTLWCNHKRRCNGTIKKNKN